MAGINIIGIISFGIILHNFVAGIMRKEYILTRTKAVIGFICLLYVAFYIILLREQIAFFTYGAHETTQDFFQFIRDDFF